MDWFIRDFDHPAYFEIYRDKAEDAAAEGPCLSALLDLPPGARVLDLPCGWGRLRPALEAWGFDVVGGDLSPLNLARHQAEHPGTLARLDLRALPFRDGCADGVLCAYTSWGYFASDAENLRQLQEFARVLAPGGVLLLDLAGRGWLEEGVRRGGGRWIDLPRLGYRERARWSRDRRRIRTERIFGTEAFRHDIWIPTHEEVLHALEAAGFEVAAMYGGLDGSPWRLEAARWIYRAFRKEA